MQASNQAQIAHLSLFDLAVMIRASADASWRDYMFALAEATANVLTDERLAQSDLRVRFAADGERFRVVLGDLTAEGLAFPRKGYQRWLANADRWKGERTVPKLEASLRKQLVACRRGG